MIKNFEIQSGQRTYPVYFEESLKELASNLQKKENIVFVIDKKVFSLYQAELSGLFQSSPVLQIEANEENKSFSGVETVVDWFVSNRVTKSSHVVVIGGGIIQDISAFSAGVYYRGIPWTFVPTTLLAMSDSCIGAKTGINWKNAKNQLGVFNSPHAVHICTDFLKTLDPNDVKSGYGEILKLYLTAGYEKFLELEKEVGQYPNLYSVMTKKHIFESLQVKKAVIEIDEYEKDLRRILNFGHTFGHALETVTNHAIPHGLAVAWGMDFVNYLSTQDKALSHDKYLQIKAFIKRFLLVPFSEAINSDQIMAVAKRDKKAATDGIINMIYFTDGKSLEIKKTKLNEVLLARLNHYILNENLLRHNEPI